MSLVTILQEEIYFHLSSVSLITYYQGSHAVLKVLKKYEFQNWFSRPWKSIEFCQNVH